MNDIFFENLKEELTLRKVGYTNSQSKKGNNGSNKTIFIGYLEPHNEFPFKINFIFDDLKTLDEPEFKKYILTNFNNFKIDIKALLNEGIELLSIFSKEKNRMYFTEFKQLLSNILTDYSDITTKKHLLTQLYKKNEKKANKIIILKQEEANLQSILDKLQITEYHTYFSLARSFKRKLKLYIGPTNSGKTYHALNDLAAHNQGIYLSPLRLLAWEGKEELEKRGKVTSLITGEEKVIEENATFKAQTIETLNFNEITDAILIDEIQMLYDDNRGWAWTQALIGSPCKELIMAGSPESEPLVQKIADILGEDLEVIRLNRFNPLEVIPKFFDLSRDISNIPDGTALIAFSRKNVLAYKQLFENHNKPVSVIYGNLSPEVRKEEARKFRDGETKYLISTDAISMGLNLPISTIIFTTVEKFNGIEVVELTPTEIKQIAGRAGRYGKVEKGEVSALDPSSLHFIKKTIKLDDKTNPFFYIKPSLEHVKKISIELGNTNLFAILTFFTNKVMSKVADLYVCSNLDEQKQLAILLDQIPGLELSDKFLFNNAPVPNEDLYNLYIGWIKLYQLGQTVPLPSIRVLNPVDYNFDKQLILETYVKILHLYSWLCYKKENCFIDLAECQQQRDTCNTQIEEFLKFKKRT